MNLPRSYDVLVVGGGHAGTEAAAVAARMGGTIALITQDLTSIGAMSCNPAIGGIGKGHMVCEIDALDGLMARAIDKAGIMFSILNRKKGPAVQGPRAQADRTRYKQTIQSFLKEHPHLYIIEGRVDDLIEIPAVYPSSHSRCVEGVILQNGERIKAKSVILTTGTFLRGRIYRGTESFSAGRMGENAVNGLSKRLESWQLPLSRLRTGTPPRLDGRTISWESCEQQHGDSSPHPFSVRTPSIDVEQVACGITYTNSATHEIIRNNLHLSASVSSRLSGNAPRYCPSIEDKLSRFADKERHRVFLEPEGLHDTTVYPNGISNSLPSDLQEKFLRTMKGLENVQMIAPGYTIEYDYVDPRSLQPNLALRDIEGLFLAGQINGTTGYEEAGGQGIVAGINAALFSANRSEQLFDRASSYIGVMIDDLISAGVSEPYRMLTARAEHRLLLRCDNADQRLSGIGLEIGCLSEEMQRLWLQKKAHLEDAQAFLSSHCFSPQELEKRGFYVKKDGIRRSFADLFAFDEVTFSRLHDNFPEYRTCLSRIPKNVQTTLEIAFRYKDYILRQERAVEHYRKEEGRYLPTHFDYQSLIGLSNEVKDKLMKERPHTLDAAGKIEGVTPAALLMILHALEHEKSSTLQ